MIIRDAIRYKYCCDEIESASSKSFVTCSCGKFTIGGGFWYLERDSYTCRWSTELSEVEEAPSDHTDVRARWRESVEHRLVSAEALSVLFRRRCIWRLISRRSRWAVGLLYCRLRDTLGERLCLYCKRERGGANDEIILWLCLVESA